MCQKGSTGVGITGVEKIPRRLIWVHSVHFTTMYLATKLESGRISGRGRERV